MPQTTDRPLASGLTAPAESGVRALVRRLAIAGLLLTALTILASIVLASQI